MTQFQLPYHHPVKEDMMTCTSCHDPHAATEKQLITHERTNELCFNCHQDKQGPFIFEHDPVQEDCMICHNPHGTVSRALLNMGEPALCLQCHEFHFHAGYKAVDELDARRRGPHELPGRVQLQRGLRDSLHRPATCASTGATCPPRARLRAAAGWAGRG